LKMVGKHGMREAKKRCQDDFYNLNGKKGGSKAKKFGHPKKVKQGGLVLSLGTRRDLGDRKSSLLTNWCRMKKGVCRHIQVAVCGGQLVLKEKETNTGRRILSCKGTLQKDFLRWKKTEKSDDFWELWLGGHKKGQNLMM